MPTTIYVLFQFLSTYTKDTTDKSPARFFSDIYRFAGNLAALVRDLDQGHGRAVPGGSLQGRRRFSTWTRLELKDDPLDSQTGEDQRASNAASLPGTTTSSQALFTGENIHPFPLGYPVSLKRLPVSPSIKGQFLCDKISDDFIGTGPKMSIIWYIR